MIPVGGPTPATVPAGKYFFATMPLETPISCRGSRLPVVEKMGWLTSQRTLDPEMTMRLVDWMVWSDAGIGVFLAAAPGIGRVDMAPRVTNSVTWYTASSVFTAF